MDSKTQDPKYSIIDGALANTSTREFIPEYEPVFMVRGQDEHAIPILREYMSMCEDENHRKAVYKRIKEFEEFKLMNPERMGEPDTDTGDQWPDETTG